MKIRKLQIAIMAAALAGAMSASAALTWNFTTASDYSVDGDWWTSGGAYVPVITGVGAYVPARPYNPSDPDDVKYGSDWAAVFAKINTQAPGLLVGDITGGGFTLSGFSTPTPQTPNVVYGSLYLSPTGGEGSTVMINMSPMSYTGTGGNLIYTFDLNTAADVKSWDGLSWSTALTTGTFGGAIAWVNANAAGNYAAFFGPQIGMSGTSGTTFTVSEIELQVVPEPTTMIAGALLLLPFGASTIRMLRKNRKA